MSNLLSDEAVLELLKIIERRDSQAESLKHSERAIIAHVAQAKEGVALPLVPAASGELIEYEVVIRTSNRRIWRSETVVAAILDAMGYDVSKFMAPPRLKSVAQVEKIVGRQALEGLWINPSRGAAVMKVGSGFERATFA